MGAHCRKELLWLGPGRQFTLQKGTRAQCWESKYAQLTWRSGSEALHDSGKTMSPVQSSCHCYRRCLNCFQETITFFVSLKKEHIGLQPRFSMLHLLKCWGLVRSPLKASWKGRYWVTSTLKPWNYSKFALMGFLCRKKNGLTACILDSLSQIC